MDDRVLENGIACVAGGFVGSVLGVWRGVILNFAGGPMHRRAMLTWVCAILVFLSYSLVSHASVPTRPRVLLTPDIVNSLKAKQSAGDADWQELKARADQYLTLAVAPYQRNGCPPRSICYAYQGSGWLEAIRILGVAYQVTGQAAYASQVIAILDAANAPFHDAGSVEPLSLDRGYPSRSAALGLALAFDWVYDQLDSTRKAQTIRTLNAWFDWYRIPGNAWEGAGPAYGNYFGGHLLGFGAVGCATSGDNPRAEEIQQFVSERFQATVPSAFTSGGFAGGYAVESYNYGASQFAYLFQYMQIAAVCMEQTVDSIEYGRKVARSLLHNVKPNRWQISDEGDYPGDYTGVLPGFLPLLLASILEGTLEGEWMQWLYTHLPPPPGYGIRIQKPDPYFRLVYGDSNRSARDYATEPTFYRSAGDEHVYARSDWTENAVWASFAAGGAIWTGHESRKAGHIAIQRGSDYLLVNSGQWKGETGVFGRPQAFNLASWRANTLFVDDLGDYMYSGGAYTGGQGYWGTNSVISFDAGSHYVYSKADLTLAYQRRPDMANPEIRAVQSFIRSFMFLGDKYFVVWDRVSALKPSYTKKLFWHLNPMGGMPVRNGTLVEASIGSSKLFLQTLLPVAPIITITGDGLTGIADPTPITYRVEVSDSVERTDLNVLHVITAASRDEVVPVASRTEVVDGNMVGAVIEDTISRVVLFSADGLPQADVTYQANYPGAGRHMIVDLVPGVYQIRADGAEIFPALSTTPAGVLTFETAGGARFTVNPEEGRGGVSLPRVPGAVK